MPKVLTEADEVPVGSTIIVPGVGSFDRGMAKMQETGFEEMVRTHHSQGGSILGICLGMQLLAKSSAEGTLSGTGILDCRFERFEVQCSEYPTSARQVKDMNMGLRKVIETSRTPAKLKTALAKNFYFVHRYRTKASVDCEWGVSSFGETFSAIVGSGNTVGVQFHPEKSGRRGLELLEALLTVNRL